MLAHLSYSAQISRFVCLVGLQNGQILQFDLRHTQHPVSQRQSPRHLPIHSLAPVALDGFSSLVAASIFAVEDIALVANRVDGQCYSIDTDLAAGQRVCTSASVHDPSGTALHVVRQPQLRSMQYCKSWTPDEDDK